MEGETVVTSGNFLLDSESRMRAAGSSAAGEAALDPICGMEVEETKARAQGLVSEHAGTTWFFCAPGCKQAFDRDPGKAITKVRPALVPVAEERRTTIPPGSKAFHAQDPVCGMEVDPDDAARVGLVSTFQGAPFSFCSPQCKEVFDRDPRAALIREEGARAMPAAEPPGMEHGGGHGGMPPAMPQETPPEPETGHEGRLPPGR
jgi:YHS domain-containing protein